MSTEVYSNAVAMTFEGTGKEVPAKDKKSQKVKSNKQPKMTQEEFKEMVQRKIEMYVTNFAGNYVEFVNGTGLFVCGAEADGKYYYVWFDKDRRIQLTDTKHQFNATNGHINIQREIPMVFSVLDYLRFHDKDYLMGEINTYLEEGGYTVIGEPKVCIEWKPSPKKDNARFKKHRKEKNNKGDKKKEKKK